MQRPPASPPGLTERISRPVVVALRFAFFLLIFYLLLSIAAGLLIPGQELGRYALVTEPGQSCRDLERALQEFNLNQVDYRVVPAEMAELAGEFEDGNLCWLEIAGIPAEGVGDAATPLYDAALEKTAGTVSMERAYEPRYGRVESIAIWLVSILLALVVIARPRKKAGADDE